MIILETRQFPIYHGDLFENVELNTGAFPTNRMNALSSVLDFKFKTPRRDKWTTNAVVGTSDLGVTLEGPTGNQSSLVINARRSYLQALFKILDLPFLPIYNDLQYKWVNQINENTQLTLLGIGAFDTFQLNTDLATSSAILDYLEIQNQWNYTQGARIDIYVIFSSLDRFCNSLSQNRKEILLRPKCALAP